LLIQFFQGKSYIEEEVITPRRNKNMGEKNSIISDSENENNINLIRKEINDLVAVDRLFTYACLYKWF